ncbi:MULTISPECIES: hypothetical protein [unclassified Mesorhizobium]|uniref:hypothetical protein n=1 Tax=unclassified Mesorhizobium TaxID=325217 RepID=UPI00333747C8
MSSITCSGVMPFCWAKWKSSLRSLDDPVPVAKITLGFVVRHHLLLSTSIRRPEPPAGAKPETAERGG